MSNLRIPPEDKSNPDNFVDRSNCYTRWFYTESDCHDCPKLVECKEQWKLELGVVKDGD